MVSSQLQKRIDAVVTNLFLGIISLFALFPFVAIVLTSFKGKADVLTSPPTLLPSRWLVESYEQVFRSNMLRFYLPNTLINALCASLLVVPIAGLAGYALSRYRFRGRTLLLFALLAIMMIPSLTNLVSLYRLASDFRLLNTNAVIIAVYTGGGLPFSIWILKSFFDQIPRELEEAALIDGATPLQVLLHVTLPLAMPGILAAFLLNLVDCWNEFLAAVTLLSSTPAKTTTVGLLDFQSEFEIAYHVQAAACVLIALPVILLFLLTRKIFFRAMLEGAVKG